MKISTTTHIPAQWKGAHQALELLKESGFDCVDYTAFTVEQVERLMRPEEEMRVYYRSVRAAGEKCGIGFGQLHAPFPSYVHDPERDAEIFTSVERAIMACGELACPFVVVHPPVLPGRIYDRLRDENRALCLDFYTRLIPALRAANVRLAVENMFSSDKTTGHIVRTQCSSAEDLIDIIDTMNEIAGEERFVACLDVGHALLTADSPADMARKLGKRLRVLHVQDNNGLQDQHSAPFTGVVDWEDFVAALKEIGYPGSFSFEADSFVGKFGPECVRESTALLCAIGKKLTAEM